MLNLANKPHTCLSKKVFVTICSGWLISGSVYALEVNSGQFIQTIYPKDLRPAALLPSMIFLMILLCPPD